MRINERYKKVIEWFSENMPQAGTELHYGDPYSLLVAVMLSAQCTDKRVNMITPALLERYPTVFDMAATTTEELYHYIRSISYPNNKAKNIVAMAKKVVADHGGEIPDTVEELLTLPGVGRKTANVMGAVVFGREVMPVDTHVFRVSRRIGLTVGAKTPLEAERQLTEHIPPPLLPLAHHWLILHGRYVCTARKPKCGECGISEFCKYKNK